MIGRTSVFVRNAVNSLARNYHSVGGVPGEVIAVGILHNFQIFGILGNSDV